MGRVAARRVLDAPALRASFPKDEVGAGSGMAALVRRRAISAIRCGAAY